MSIQTNLFLVGAAKAGTTSIVNVLSNFKEIYIPPIKEPNFFSSDIDVEDFRSEYYQNTIFDSIDIVKLRKNPRHLAFIRNPKNYKLIYQSSEKLGHLYYLDGSTSYLYSQIAAQNIKTYNPNSKIIICLRNPITRTFSHFKMDVAQGRQKNKSIIQAIKTENLVSEPKWGREHLYLGLSEYSKQLTRYFDVFPKENILVLFFEELKTDPTKFYNQISTFLKLKSKDINKSFLLQKHNESKQLKSQKIKAFKKILPTKLKSLAKIYLGSFLYSKNLEKVFTEKEREFLMIYLKPEIEDTIKILTKYGITIPNSFLL